MKIVSTTDKGWVGTELKNQGIISLGVDINDESALSTRLKEETPDVLIHNAAITDVAFCQAHEKAAFRTNVAGTMNIVNLCSEMDIPIVYLSTDYVFSGKSMTLLPDEKSKPDPLNTYGFTKFAGEVALITATVPTVVVRTSKLINGRWLVERGLDSLRNGIPIEAATFLVRGFLYLPLFVKSLLRISEYLATEKPSYHDCFHVSSTQPLSYYYFWYEVCIQKRIDPEKLLLPRTVYRDDLVDIPKRGGLDCSRAIALGFMDENSYHVKLSINASLKELS